MTAADTMHRRVMAAVAALEPGIARDLLTDDLSMHAPEPHPDRPRRRICPGCSTWWAKAGTWQEIVEAPCSVVVNAARRLDVLTPR